MQSTQPAENVPQPFSDETSEPQRPSGEAELDISDAARPESPSRVSTSSPATAAAVAALQTPRTSNGDLERAPEGPPSPKTDLVTSTYETAAKTYNWAWKNRERIIEAGLNGLSPTIQGIGTMTGHLQTYGVGVALGALDGLNQTATEMYRAYQIHREPEKTHQQPNYLRAANGVVNMLGAAAYGASSAGALNPYAGGIGAVAQGLSLGAKQFLRKETETYYPSLPTHHNPGAHEIAALETNAAPDDTRSRRSTSSHSPAIQHPKPRPPHPAPGTSHSR